MNKLIDRIKEQRKSALKQKESITTIILSVLLSEAKAIAKREKDREVVDSDVIRAAKSLIKKNNELLQQRENEELIKENEILESYLPQLITGKELEDYLDNLILQLGDSKSNMNTFMKTLKEDAGERADMSYASKYLKEKLV